MPYLLFTLIISIIVAVFAVQNAADVTVGFLMWTVQTSLVVVILGAALLGAGLAFGIRFVQKIGFCREGESHVHSVQIHS